MPARRRGRVLSAHFFHRRYTKNTKSGGNHNADGGRHREARRGGLHVALLQEAQARVVVAAVPQRVKLARKIIEVERDAVRLPGLGGERDQPRPFGELARERLGLAGRRVLGFIGSFYAYEGLPLLVQALPALLATDPDIRLLLVGGGPDEKRIRERSRELGVEDAVVLTGRVPHAEVQSYYDLVDVLVYPRLSMRLTELVTPLKPLEAMAEGRLVVASDVGGHRELIEDGVTGRLFRAGDASALAAVVSALLRERGSWPAFQRAGRRYVTAERNWAASVARYEPVYARLG